MKKTILLGACLIGLVGCVNTTARMVDGAVPLRATDPASVIVYASGADVGRPYRQLAEISADAEAQSGTTRADMYVAMQKKAAALGANAIIIDPGYEPSPLLEAAGRLAGAKYTRWRHGTAIFVDSLPVTYAAVSKN